MAANSRFPHEPLLCPLGENAILVEFGESVEESLFVKVTALQHILRSRPFPGMTELVPSFAALAVYYDPAVVLEHGTEFSGLSTKSSAGRTPQEDSLSPYRLVTAHLQHCLRRIDVSAARASHASRTVTLPVCYGGEYGPDLERVAELNRLTVEEVIGLHSGADYLVYMIGFLPGFPYLGGMSPRIAAPRHPSPRAAIPPGSVGIAGTQTGIYPLSSPGGWQLIGRTPAVLFDSDGRPPSLLAAGDTVRFQSISSYEFKHWQEVRT